MRIRRILGPGMFPACLVLVSLALCSCGPRAIGYGVVLWGETSGPAATGAVVSIIKQSQLNNMYFYVAPGEKTPREIPMGRVRFFNRRSDAAKFVGSYTGYLSTWAVSRKQDPPPLPVREEPKAEAKPVYKLKPGQLIKVVGRTETKETIKPYTNYWYEVVTEDGFGGWCFGHYLSVFTAWEDPAIMARKIMSQDEVLDRILGSTWRPIWFKDMQAMGTIDLTRFREEIGLFPEPSENIFRLVLPRYSLDFRYERLERVGTGNYECKGTDLRISVLDDERIQINYKYKNQEVGGVYVVFEKDVAELVAAEQKRRQEIFDSFMAKGGTLASSAYGRIRLEPGMRFSWQGYERLVPAVIARGAGAEGSVDFPYHLAKGLQGAYDGVITFAFDALSGQPASAEAGSLESASTPRAGTPGARGAPDVHGLDASPREASFLYKTAPGGLRFTSLTPDSFQDLHVNRVGISPVIIFFSQGQNR